MNRSKLRQRPRGKTKTKSFDLKGGLNLVDSPLSIPEGMCLAATNYELLPTDGYRRSDGFERFDGQGKPSEASYWILNYDAGTTPVSEGDVVTGGTSGHTGKALIDGVGTTASGYLVLTDCTGVFQDDEDLEVSAAKVSEANGVATERGASTSALDSTYLQDAIETRRALITKLGASDGSGRVRGLHVYQGVLYGFRDNAAGTAGLMWKSTSAGWVQQSLGNRVAFTAGTAEFLETETLTGGTSSATATINRVVLQSGDWSTNDAAGYLIIGAVTGGPFQAETGTSASGSATLSGAETANTLAAGGRYEFRTDNFYGSSVTKRMYGVSGVDYAFEWDGTVFVPIITGNTVDTPTHLEIYEFHLFLVFTNGSLQNSATGVPYQWAGGGANEIGVGSDIVGLQREVGGAMIVLCRDRAFQLLGKNTVASPWDLQNLSDESGGIEWTMNRLGRTRYLDDGGFFEVRAVQEFGNFESTSFSQVIQKIVDNKKELATASLIVKKKSQVRTFFSDGSAIVATFKGTKLAGFTTHYYNDSDGAPIVIRCTAQGEASTGSEVLFLGTDDGYVYQADAGTSFDGFPLTSTFILAYSNLDSPSYDKAFKKLVMDLEGAIGAVLNYSCKFDYASGRWPAGVGNEATLLSGRTYWGEVYWNNFNWSGADVAQIEGPIEGSGRTISVQVVSTGTYVQPHTISSLTYHYILRKLVR